MALGMLAGPAAAAPMGAAAVDARTVVDGSSTVENVTYYGRRHRGYSSYYGYRWSPPVYSYGYYGYYKPYYSDYYYKPRYKYYGDYGYYGYKPYYKPYYGSYGYRRWY